MTTLSINRKPLNYLHEDHKKWLEEVLFYKDEVKIFTKRLEEIASRNTGIDVQKQVEHFQNQFIIQKEKLDMLQHDLNIHEQWLAIYAKEHPSHIEEELFADHAVMRRQINMFEKIYTELKTEYLDFLEKWM
ncbi:MAG: hypothetical protein A3F72_18855 [Bacteroidetes bacterium RIFCSPLOWO2_12_FULL_35_15]|nr:MAG: hypothetical protein A3F72_18855 [Bacteroidetes bacterium RIFCSPLOWO2_12_FULL_35_15]